MNDFDKEVKAAELLQRMYYLCDEYDSDLSDKMRHLICELGRTGFLSNRARRIAKQRQRPPVKPNDPKHDGYLAWFDGLSDQEQIEELARLREAARDMGVELDGTPEVEPQPVNPEQVAHEEQDRIDATAADLLVDIDM
jgi:hypothetical protein